MEKSAFGLGAALIIEAHGTGPILLSWERRVSVGAVGLGAFSTQPLGADGLELDRCLMSVIASISLGAVPRQEKMAVLKLLVLHVEQNIFSVLFLC